MNMKLIIPIVLLINLGQAVCILGVRNQIVQANQETSASLARLP